MALARTREPLMSLRDHVKISRRFLRSVRIDSDVNDLTRIEGFICTPSAAEVLESLARHVCESGQGAFTWTGPYGSGKSSLIAVLSALLGGDAALRAGAEDVLGNELATSLKDKLPVGTDGWRILPVVGRREHPVTVIGDAIAQAGLVTRKPRGGWSDTSVVAALSRAALAETERHGGLVLFIDEMGKFLEHAAQEGSDVYFFQQLAEAASRSNGRLVVVGVLHQAFDEYAHRLTHEMRDEWAKVQGRFIDLIVDTAGEEQIDLISRAIETDATREKTSPAASIAARFVRGARDSSNHELASKLEACWPLHPIVACLLGPISRRRFGQNQRSIFGFLNSAERHGFQDYLQQTTHDLYAPHRLWEYLRVNIEPSILASPDGHRWALAAEAVERCEAMGGDDLHIRLLKTIAVVDLFKERSGLAANDKLLRSCFSDVQVRDFQKALRDLDTWSFTIVRKFADARSIYAGSDFDIDDAIRNALENHRDVDFEMLRSSAGLQPVLAKRHYHSTGSLRWFDVDVVPLDQLREVVSEKRSGDDTVGRFLLAIPTDGEPEEKAKKTCREAARRSDESGDVVVGFSRQSWAITPLARELRALEQVSNDHPELAGDSVARREVSGRIAALQARLETELHKAFDNAVWFRKHRQAKALRQAELNGLASDMADKRFNGSPILHNELMNRQKPSSSAIAAQNNLLRHMTHQEGEERLGIKGFPAERGLFASLLESTELYVRDGKQWRFASPQKEAPDPCRLAPMWEKTNDYLKAHSHRAVPASELFDLWKQPPFGVKKGLMPVLGIAYLLSKRDKLAVYRDGVFRAKFDDVDADYLAKDAASIQLRWMELDDLARRLLSGMAQVVRGLDETNELTHLQPIDVGRGLVAIYSRLPRWTARTMQLSANAIRIRDLFKQAHDPNRFLFDDIPASLGEDISLADKEGMHRIVQSVHEGLTELVKAYPSMLSRLNDLMLAELRVPNASPQALAELRDRAENIRQLAGDFRLDAFIGRLSQFDGSERNFEGIASLAANKPPRDWVDPDRDRAAIALADMAQNFLRAETFARVKGRPDKRHSMAVVIGMNGRPTPLMQEFDVADSDRVAIESLATRIKTSVADTEVVNPSIVLAALAEFGSRYMKEIRAMEENRAQTQDRLAT